MRYLAIVDDEFLSNFRVDVGYPPHSDMILVVKDEKLCTRGIRLKPLPTEALVTKDGKSVYLRQEHIDCLREMERKEMIEKAVQNITNAISKLGENDADSN